MKDLESLKYELQGDTKVKVAGIDVDGILRGKLMAKSKFLSVAETGFGFCSVVFGWDMHDQTYFKELKISNAQNGYRDIIAVPDLSSFRRIPWEGYVPFFLVTFYDPDTHEPVSACPRGLLEKVSKRIEEKGLEAMAGGKGSSPNLRVNPSFGSLIHEKSDRNRGVKRSTSSINSALQNQTHTDPWESATRPPQHDS